MRSRVWVSVQDSYELWSSVFILYYLILLLKYVANNGMCSRKFNEKQSEKIIKNTLYKSGKIIKIPYINQKKW